MADTSSSSQGTNVLIAVTGCIAAYKACEVLRGLQKAGCDVRVTMTNEASAFVAPLTFEALSGHAVASDLFLENESPIAHIEMTDWADLVLVCPCTGNVLSKVACGIADDCVTTTLLAADSPVLIAPAMNVRMWSNAATQANLETLRSRGVGIVMPVEGHLACGSTGDGKLASVDEIVSAALAQLGVARDLEGRHVMVTAGPTHEAIDPVRFLSNASSGKMGYAIAAAARRHGADVTLISGPVALEAPQGVDLVEVVSAREMHEAALASFETCDAAICAAAVADYTPAHPADHKLKKSSERLDAIELVETADILRDLSAVKGTKPVVGFAAETTDLIAHAQEKLRHKGCDLIVANDVSRADSTFGSETDKVTLISPAGIEELPCLSKRDVAERVVQRLSAMIGAGDAR